MTDICRYCGHDKFRKRGYEYRREKMFRRLECIECGRGNYFIHTQQPLAAPALTKRIFPESKTYVITSAQNGAKLNDGFLDSLEHYCDINQATLLVIPNRYQTLVMAEWPSRIEKYLMSDEMVINENLKILGNINISTTAANPLSGLSPITAGRTTIIGHPQLAMTTVPVNKHDDHIILTTTGSLTESNYRDTKAGYKAKFHHSLAAIVVELTDGNTFHLRQLCADSDGSFYDLGHRYTSTGYQGKERVSALVTGDEHVIQMSDNVRIATYEGDGCMVSDLRPLVIVRHDVLDCYSISHHHQTNFLLRYKKHIDDQSILRDELNRTCEFIVDTTPPDSKSIIVESNHNNHLRRWLNETDPKLEVWNAEVYYELMYRTIDSINSGETEDPFEIYFKYYYGNQHGQISFVDREAPISIRGVLISMHGDIGPNGSRGSRRNLSTVSEKSVIGHSHSPGIEKGCWQVGTSSKLSLEYNKGPSGWMNTHCIIHPNGKRQLINIIKGEWRRKR